MVLRALAFERGFFGRTVQGVAAKHPPGQAADSKKGDQEGQAHPEPTGHPFAREKQHGSNYRQDDVCPAPLGCY